MAITIGDFEADSHCYHTAALGTDLSVIEKQSLDRSLRGSTVTIHHHLSTESCQGSKHRTYKDGAFTDYERPFAFNG